MTEPRTLADVLVDDVGLSREAVDAITSKEELQAAIRKHVERQQSDERVSRMATGGAEHTRMVRASLSEGFAANRPAQTSLDPDAQRNARRAGRGAR